MTIKHFVVSGFNMDPYIYARKRKNTKDQRLAIEQERRQYNAWFNVCRCASNAAYIFFIFHIFWMFELFKFWIILLLDFTFSHLCIFLLHFPFSFSGQQKQTNPKYIRVYKFKGTKFWRPPIKVTQFWRPRSGFGALFL